MRGQIYGKIPAKSPSIPSMIDSMSQIIRKRIIEVDVAVIYVCKAI